MKDVPGTCRLEIFYKTTERTYRYPDRITYAKYRSEDLLSLIYGRCQRHNEDESVLKFGFRKSISSRRCRGSLPPLTEPFSGSTSSLAHGATKRPLLEVSQRQESRQYLLTVADGEYTKCLYNNSPCNRCEKLYTSTFYDLIKFRNKQQKNDNNYQFNGLCKNCQNSLREAIQEKGPSHL